MILSKSGEVIDFMFRCRPVIDKTKVGLGWLYITNLRIAFESDRCGLCFAIHPSVLDSQRAYGSGRFKFTWTEQNDSVYWRYAFDGEIKKWNDWQPAASYVVEVLQDAVYSDTGLLAAGWRIHNGIWYNKMSQISKKIPSLTGKTPEEQRMYRQWRETWGHIIDMDFDFLHGKHDNSTLRRLNDLKIENARLCLNNLDKQYKWQSKYTRNSTVTKKQSAPDGQTITPERVKKLHAQYVVQKRILQIIKQERKHYTFGRHIDLRMAELYDVLYEMHTQGKDISEYVPPSNIQSAMVQAHRDIAKFQEKLTVQLPVF